MASAFLALLVVLWATTSAHLSRPPSDWLNGMSRVGNESFRVLSKRLVKLQELASRLPPGVDKGVERGRYWNVGMDERSGTAWMLGKAIGRHGLYLNLFLNCSARLDDCLRSERRSFRVGQYVDVTENFGIFSHKDAVVGIGGENGETKNYTTAEKERRAKRGLPEESGAWIVRATSLQSLVRDGWSQRFRAFDNYTGCFENYFSRCKLDSKFSVARLNDFVYVYIRANLNETGGGRAVQVIQLPLDDWLFGTHNLFNDAPFRLVEFSSNKRRTRERGVPSLPNETCRDEHVAMLNDYSTFRSLKENDIYLFNVNPNPVRPGSLLATFPIVLDFQCASIAIAASQDGIHFSSPLPIIATETYLRTGRTFDHPIDGFHVRGDTVSLYVQANVQGIASKDLDLWPPNIVRYVFDSHELGIYTDHALLETVLDDDDEDEQVEPPSL